MPDPLLSILTLIALGALGGVFFWPARGLVPRWQQARRVNERVLREDALKHIHHCETGQRPPSVESLAGALQISGNRAVEILAELEAHKLVSETGGELHLTPPGREYALRIIRAHRLWERYLAEETGFAAATWHAQAEQVEHTLTPEAIESLASQLGHPTYDPHGDPIPTAQGDLAPRKGQLLTTLPLDTPARILHLEDEPEAIFAQLAAEGLLPGLEVRVTGISPQRIRFWAGGEEHVLAPILARSVTVEPLSNGRSAPLPSLALTSLQPGERATVAGISPALRGPERRRLLDLGIIPGTEIAAELRSPSGDPTAYRIRGAMIALRKPQADLIKITRLDAAP